MSDKTEASGFDAYLKPMCLSVYDFANKGEMDSYVNALKGAYQAGLNARGDEAVDIVHIAKKFIDGDESLQSLEMALDDYFDPDLPSTKELSE